MLQWGWMEQEQGMMVAQRPTLFSSSVVLQLHRHIAWCNEPHLSCPSETRYLFPPRDEMPFAGVGQWHHVLILCKLSGSLSRSSWEKSVLLCAVARALLRLLSAVRGRQGSGRAPLAAGAPKAFPSGALAQPMLIRKGVIQRSCIRTFSF